MISYLAVKKADGQWIAYHLIPKSLWLSTILLWTAVITPSINAQTCPPTTGISATQTVVDGKNAVVVNWDANPSASRYLVYFRSVGNPIYTQLKTNSNSKTIVGLPPDTEFEVKIRTFCPGVNHFTSPLIFTSGSTGLSCSYPVNLSATSETIEGHHSTFFDWDAVPEAKFYVVFYRLQGTSSFRQRAVVEDSLRVNNLALDSIYEWRVRTVCSWDQSFRNPEDSPIEEATTQSTGTFCSPTDNLFASSTTQSGYNATDLTWDNIPGADGYFLQYRINGSGTPWNSVTLAGASPHRIAGLSSNMLYDIRVQTLCNIGPRIRSEDPLNSSQNFDYVTGSFTSGNSGTTCDTPLNVRQTGEVLINGNYNSTFSWDAVAGVDHYKINYLLGGRILHSVTTTNNSITLSGLEAEYYIIKVQSICTPDQSVESAWSPWIRFTPSLNCTEPEGLSSTPSVVNGFNVADLSWNDVTSASSYEIRYRPEGSLDWNYQTSSSSSSRIEYLQSRTDYEWQVRSICSLDGNIGSTFSSVDYFTTSNGRNCATPRNLRSRSIFNSVLLRWSNVPNAQSYDVQIRVQGDTDWTTLSAGFFVTILSGFPPNTTYDWRVRAVCSQDPYFASAYSDIETFNTGRGSIFGRSAQAAESTLNLKDYREGQLLSNEAVVISPNPAIGSVNLIPLEAESVNHVEIYNTHGHRVRSINNHVNGTITIGLDNLVPGLYLIKTTTAIGKQTSKLIVQ